MAKTKNSGTDKPATKTLEERLARLEVLGDQIRRTDIPLDDALKAFEEGIKLAQSLEKELEKIQNRIEILMSGTEAKVTDNPELELFDSGE
ncbi:MAG: exodeoxyribonuclease VII small subunit [Treponema sp.]|jgi:exodeoxyribonuclease VII small subunit|nr:exodeoxyribonuclease VII small subunit [Treponema sp.]